MIAASMPVVALTAVLLQSYQDGSGYRYTFRMKTDHRVEVTGSVREDGHSARLDISGDRDDDSYLLILDDGRRVVSVHPHRREYQVVDDTALERVVGLGLRAAEASGVVRFRVRDADVSSERLGHEVIDGRSTERYRLTQEFTVSVSALGFSGDDIHQHVVTDYWVDASLKLVPNPLIVMLSNIASALGQVDPDLTRRTAIARRQLFHGTPVRIVVTSDGSDPPGKSSVQTLEITDLHRDRFDAGIWRIPAGFHRRPGDDFSWSF